MRFISLKNIHAGTFFRPYTPPIEIGKIPSLIDFHSLYQLLHSQGYHKGLKL